MQVGHPCVARVAAAADDVATAHARTRRQLDRIGGEVAELGVFARGVLDDDVIAGVASLAIGGPVARVAVRAHDGAVGGRQHGPPVAGEGGERRAAPGRRRRLRLRGDEVEREGRVADVRPAVETLDDSPDPVER